MFIFLSDFNADSRIGFSLFVILDDRPQMTPLEPYLTFPSLKKKLYNPFLNSLTSFIDDLGRYFIY